jgi:hypothetical protein
VIVKIVGDEFTGVVLAKWIGTVNVTSGEVVQDHSCGERYQIGIRAFSAFFYAEVPFSIVSAYGFVKFPAFIKDRHHIVPMVKNG